jgi:hypothetical protein
VAVAEKRRPCAQYKAPRDDSLHIDEEDNEAHPPVPSERRGVVYSGGAMVGGGGTMRFPLGLVHREKKKNGEWGRRWRR